MRNACDMYASSWFCTYISLTKKYHLENSDQMSSDLQRVVHLSFFFSGSTTEEIDIIPLGPPKEDDVPENLQGNKLNYAGKEKCNNKIHMGANLLPYCINIFSEKMKLEINLLDTRQVSIQLSSLRNMEYVFLS